MASMEPSKKESRSSLRSSASSSVAGLRDNYSPAMENQMERRMENDMETTIYRDYIAISWFPKPAFMLRKPNPLSWVMDIFSHTIFVFFWAPPLSEP